MLQLRGISGCRLMVALVFTPPSPLHFHAHRPPTPSKAWNRPWNSGHPSLGTLSLVRTQLRHPCAQRDQTTKQPSSVRSISIRAWLVARDYLAAGSGHPRVAVHEEGGRGSLRITGDFRYFTRLRQGGPGSLHAWNLDNSSAWLEPSGSNGSYSRRLALLPLSLHCPVSSHQQHLTSLRMPPPPATFTASFPTPTTTPTPWSRSARHGTSLAPHSRASPSSSQHEKNGGCPVTVISTRPRLAAGLSRTVLSTRPHDLPRLPVQSTSGMAIYLP